VSGVRIPPSPPNITTYLDGIKKTKKHRTYVAYKTAFEYFLESCIAARVTDIARSDLLQFSAFFRGTKKLQPRTVYNKFESPIPDKLAVLPLLELSFQLHIEEVAIWTVVVDALYDISSKSVAVIEVGRQIFVECVAGRYVKNCS
jgi:hypothetical protein